VSRQEGAKIVLGDTHRFAEAVRNELLLLYPAPYGASCDPQHFRKFRDGEKLHTIASVAATNIRIFSAATPRTLSPSGHLPSS
jgi:hypothetical protein